MSGEMELVWLATQIQTGQDAPLTGKAPQGAASVWGQDLFPGSVGSSCFNLNSVEAEYMAASQASCEAIWLRNMLVGLFGQEMSPTVIHCDNQSCIKLSENPVFHDRSKHIETRYHFIRDWVQRGAVQL
jgi:hypothetical protein